MFFFVISRPGQRSIMKNEYEAGAARHGSRRYADRPALPCYAVPTQTALRGDANRVGVMGAPREQARSRRALSLFLFCRKPLLRI